jgi:phosphohistidine phosphatase
MKTILLLRHAKSSWKDPALPDVARPLNRRGQAAALVMGRLVKRKSLWPDLILCSTAERTRQTCAGVLQSADRSIPTRFLDDLYHCPAEGISRVLQQLPDDIQRVMIIGHNPELAEFLAFVAGFIDKFPTGGLAELTVDVETWSEMRPRQPMSLEQLWRPRDLE